MHKVFVSYSHDDAALTERLIRDLRVSAVPATYDEWLLHVGDSIIQKISAEVSDSDNVIALLSPASVESNWVKKELALAMSAELDAGKTKVLPAVIADCNVPPMLADKLFADFRRGYYVGLRALLETLLPRFYEHEKFIAGERIEAAQKELATLVEGGDRKRTVAWLRFNSFSLASLFGRLWAVSEAVPDFPVNGDVADFFVINGQSARYHLSLVLLSDTTWNIRNADVARREIARLRSMLAWCRTNEEEVRHVLAVRMASSYGAEQIAPSEREPWRSLHCERPLHIDAKLLLGRRRDYGDAENDLRNSVHDETRGDIDILSYDRLSEAIGLLLRAPW